MAFSRLQQLSIVSVVILCLLPDCMAVSLSYPLGTNTDLISGSTVTFTATVTDPTDPATIRLLKKPLYLPTQDWDDVQAYDITLGGELSTAFKATGRYLFKQTQEGNKYSLNVTVVGVKPEDGGYLGIGADGQSVFSSGKAYTVRVPVKSVHFKDAKYYPRGQGKPNARSVTIYDGMEVTINAGKGGRDEEVMCEVAVDNSVATPNISMWLGEGPNRVNITDNFTRDSEAWTSGGAGGLSMTTYRGLYVPSKFHFGPEHHKQLFVCEAYLPDKHFPAKSANITLNIQFVPYVKCPMFRGLREGEVDATIKCIVFANPMANLSDIYWESPATAGGSSLVLRNGDKQDEMMMEYNVVNSSAVETSLIFSKFSSALHTRDFYIHAHNAMGQMNKHKVYVYVSSAGTVQLTAALGVCMLLVNWLVAAY